MFTATGLNLPGDLVFDRHGQLLVVNGAQRPGLIDYSIRRFSRGGHDLGDLFVLPTQPRGMVVRQAGAPHGKPPVKDHPNGVDR